MKRSFIAILVAALALALGYSMTASAAGGEGAVATTSAKKKAKGKKKAACPAKKKGKAKKSDATTSKAKKGKKKAKCKKAKKPGKTKPGKTKPGKERPSPGGGIADGAYGDPGQNVEAYFSGGGSTVKVSFVLTTPLILPFQSSAPVQAVGPKLKASGNETTMGGSGKLKWDLEVDTKTLNYVLTVDHTITFPEQDPINDKKVFKGTFTAGAKGISIR